jgi:nucleoside 2-deoxyribosyltransferase
MKKIYFACSIRGGRDDAELYAELVDAIKQHALVLTEIFTDTKLTAQGMKKPAPEIWQTDIAWIKQADAIIAEVTNPSLGVGYEIAKAEEWNKPVLALYRPQPSRKLSVMILGSPTVQNHEYTRISRATTFIEQFVASLA